MIDVLERSATFGGPCDDYRYVLCRTMAQTFETVPGYVLWVMLNPSTADHLADDQTIKRCLYYTYRERYAELRVVNLYGLRSADPVVLRRHESPCGPANDLHIVEEAEGAALIVVAWGSDPMVPARAVAVRELLAGRDLLCLGTNTDGQPKHPSRLGNVAGLVPWPASA